MHSATKIIIYKLTNLKCNSDCWSLGLTTMYRESDETFARHDHGVAWPKLSLSRLFYSLVFYMADVSVYSSQSLASWY